SFTANGVNQRTFSSPAQVDFGRVLLGRERKSGAQAISTSRGQAPTADSKLSAAVSGTLNGLTLSGGPNLFQGAASTETTDRARRGTLSGSGGTQTGRFQINALEEFGNTISNASAVSFTANGVNQRTFSSPAQVDFGRVLLG